VVGARAGAGRRGARVGALLCTEIARRRTPLRDWRRRRRSAVTKY